MLINFLGLSILEVLKMEDDVLEVSELSSSEGSVKISDEVVGVISGIASTEVDGVIGLSGGIAGGIAQLLGKKSLAKGIKVQTSEKDTSIDIHLIVAYGVRIPDIAQEVQEKVKTAVESMTGLKVAEVNVHIQGVSFQDEIKEEEVSKR